MLVSVVSVMNTWILVSVMSAPPGATSSPPGATPGLSGPPPGPPPGSPPGSPPSPPGAPGATDSSSGPPPGPPPAASSRRLLRSKRCSCASFLDKECVYFCHLDIIWVHTPERVVSYGLGDAPRPKRAAVDSMATGGVGARCRCLRDNDDDTCRKFCSRSEVEGGGASEGGGARR